MPTISQNINRNLSKVIRALGYQFSPINPRVKYGQYGKNSEILERSHSIIFQLGRRYKELCIKSHKEGFIFEIDGVRNYITSYEEIVILKEIYLEDSYSLQFQSDVVLIDIGMNVGLASLYFAQNNKVKEIYSYEPVKETFEQAHDNFALNNSVIHKINPHNYGLGEKNEIIKAIYNSDYKGSVGIVNSKNIRNNDSKNVAISLQIKDIAAELEKIENDKNLPIILKMDCEGAEFQIIDRLANVNMLNHFKIIILEWHHKSPKFILNTLTKAGFQCHYRQTDPQLGLIYAFQTN